MQTASNTRLTVDNVGNFTFLGGKVVFAYTGGITSTGTIITRNGTSPTSIQITNTYTSTTSFGCLDIRANAAQTAYEISSFLGSAGGANLPINIGHRDSAGTFTSGLSVAATGGVTLAGNVTVRTSGSSGSVVVRGDTFGQTGYVEWRTPAGSRQGYIGYDSGSDMTVNVEVGGAWRVHGNGGLVVRNGANSADAALTCGAITASGAITVGPPFAGYSSQIHKGINSYGLALGYSNTSTPGTTFNFEFGNARFQMVGSAAQLQAGPILGNADLIFGRNSTGPAWKSQSVGGLQVRNLADSADASFTCGAITASGTIITRNGTSPTSIQITNTYTSATSFGLLDIRANAAQTAYEISSFLGSAGGAALPINIGHRDSAGTFTSALSVATSGAITASGGVTSVANDFYVSDSGTYFFSNVTRNRGMLISSGGGGRIGFKAGGTEWLQISDAGAITASGPVGIFTDTPSRRLHVVGPAVGTASARFTGPTIDNNWGGHIEFTANNGTLYGGVVASVTGMYLSTGGTTKLSLESAGATFAGAITASGTIITRNGTSPTSIQITNTYTSSTSFGLLDIRANAAQTAYEISSFLGTAGGANLPINIGHRDSAGTFTSALSVATSGAITASGDVKVGASAVEYILIGSSTGSVISAYSNSLGYHYMLIGDSTGSGGPMIFRIGAQGTLEWQSTNRSDAGSSDLAIGRASAGLLGIYTDNTRATLANLSCAAITASGQITQVPPSSVTLGTNGQFSIEMTSNTAGNLVYRGSDGTTRRAALVFV
jgi:hypothetical protein